MNWPLLLPLLITVFMAVVGWLVGHRLNLARDRLVKHRELRLGYLIAAYRGLEHFAGREPPFDLAHVDALELAVADIQLFGNQTQIDRLNQCFSQKAEKGSGDLNSVVNELRSELRKELGLPELDGNVTWLRLDPGLISKSPNNALQRTSR